MSEKRYRIIPNESAVDIFNSFTDLHEFEKFSEELKELCRQANKDRDINGNDNLGNIILFLLFIQSNMDLITNSLKKLKYKEYSENEYKKFTQKVIDVLEEMDD
jgi:hypothetical protein